MVSGKAILAYTMYYAIFFDKYFFKGTLNSQFLVLEGRTVALKTLLTHSVKKLSAFSS